MSEQHPQNDPHAAQGAGLQTETYEFIAYTRAGKFYHRILGYPKTVMLLGLVAVGSAASLLPLIYKDLSAEAFIDPAHPSIVYNDHVEEVFGLSDPVIVAVVSEDPNGIFTPRGLNLVQSLSERIHKLPDIDPERVTSIATESSIFGDAEGFYVEPLVEGPIETQEQADAVKKAVFHMPLFVGNLVSEDGTATLITAELVDDGSGAQAFHDIMGIAEEIGAGPEKIHVAGEGAIAEYLGEYVDEDARRLYPIVLIVIGSILALAYRTIRGVYVPLTVVVGAVMVAIGVMAGNQVPFYLITNAMPIVLIATGVADGIHVIGEYYEQLALRPYATGREATVRAMVSLWRAVLFTSVTDGLGFLGIAVASTGPPMSAFGLYAALGVVASCAFSILVIPAMLAWLKPKPSPAFRHHPGKHGPEHIDAYGRFMGRIGAGVVRFPAAVLAIGAGAAVLGVAGALQLTVDYDRLHSFAKDEPIRVAGELINERFNGAGFIDIVVETDEPEALTNPAFLKKIEDLQEYAEGFEQVGGTVSIADYVKQLNRAFNEDDPAFYVIPETDMEVAQFFLLLSTASDPEMLAQVVDYNYQLANVRVAMGTSQYSEIVPVVEGLEAFVTQYFNEEGLTATLAGRNNLYYHWIKELPYSHFAGVGAALICVLFAASLSFRSLVAGLFACTPVVVSTLTIYAIMGVADVWLDVGGSMFASIGIGISVNFAIHTLHRTMELVRDYGEDIGVAMTKLFPSTGRALLFNFAAVFFGFGVLMFSQVITLFNFGLLISIAVLISFIASITLLPAMLILINPKFLQPKRKETKPAAEELEITMEEW